MNVKIEIKNISHEQYNDLMNHMLNAGYYGQAAIKAEEGDN